MKTFYKILISLGLIGLIALWFKKGKRKSEPKKVELYFNDGSKLEVGEDSPYYSDFTSMADEIFELSTKEGDE